MWSPYPTDPFDKEASPRDKTIPRGNGFPYGGYEEVLDEVFRLADVKPGMLVLDLGVGTGDLSAKFVGVGCSVWGIDPSEKMLTEAQRKLPRMSLVRADLLAEWPQVRQRFHRVVSSYAFHHFDLVAKTQLLSRIAHYYLTPEGRIVVADVAFATRQTRADARKQFRQAWEDEAHYWAADEAIAELAQSGLHCQYRQVSECGGVFTVSAAQEAA